MFIEITRVALKNKNLLNTDKILRISPAKTGSGHTEIIMTDGVKIYTQETYEEVRAMLIAEPITLESDIVPKTVLEELRDDDEPWWHNPALLRKVNEAIFGEDAPVVGFEPYQVDWEYTAKAVADEVKTIENEINKEVASCQTDSSK